MGAMNKHFDRSMTGRLRWRDEDAIVQRLEQARAVFGNRSFLENRMSRKCVVKNFEDSGCKCRVRVVD